MEKKRRLKIAIYWEQYGSGGTDTHLINLLYGWPNRSDQFLIISNYDNKGLQRIKGGLLKLENVKIQGFPSLSASTFINRYRNKWFYPALKMLKPFAHPIFFWRVQNQALHIFQKNGSFDVMMSDNGAYPAAWGCLGAIVSAKKCNIPHRILIIHHEADCIRSTRKLYEMFIDKKVFKDATSVVAVSKGTKQTICDNRYFPDCREKIKVIYNGIDLTELSFSRLSDENIDIKRKYSVKGELLIGIVGNILPHKGHEDLINALSLLESHLLRKMKLLVIGEGEKNEIKRLRGLCEKVEVRDRVVFTGYIPGCSRTIISQLDLLVVATKDFEGFGLTLAEAMSVGTSILATRVGAIPEFVKHFENGFLVSPDSPDEMADALRDFINNRDAWLERAKRVDIKYFARERMGKEFFNLLGSNTDLGITRPSENKGVI